MEQEQQLPSSPRIERNKLIHSMRSSSSPCWRSAQGWEDISDTVRQAWLSRFLKLEHSTPHEVYRRIMSRITSENVE